MSSIYVLNDFKLTKRLFAQDIMSSRKEEYWQKYIKGHIGRTYGIATTSGQPWQDQKRFALKVLKEFGFGRKGLDGVIQEEGARLIRTMLEESESAPGIILRIETNFNVPVINVLWHIIASKRFDPKAEETKEMTDITNNQYTKRFKPCHFFPTAEAVCTLLRERISTIYENHGQLH
jgi:hypothetical protein